MKFDINSHEQNVFNDQFQDCKKLEGRGDIIFVYSDEFQGDVYETTNTLQATTDFLKYITCLNPVQFFKSRIMIGHNKNDSQANWSGTKGNRIHIPWENKYLEKDKFLHSCSHELVHPFYASSPLHISNQKWGEPFCEFLRGPCLNVMGQDGKRWWHKNIEEYQKKGKDAYRNVAGQILTYAKSRYYNDKNMEFCINNLINNKEKMKKLINHLFEEYKIKSLIEIFTPVEKMKI